MVQCVEARGDFRTIDIVDGFGTDGNFRALLLCSASGALFSDDVHGVDEFLGVFRDSQGGGHVVVRHVLDVRHVSVGGQFVSVFF